MKNYFYFLAIIFLISCSNENKTEKNPLKSADTVVTKIVIDDNIPFKDTEFTELSLPINIDSGFIQKVDTNSRISYLQLRQLGVDFLKNELGDGLVYDFNEFCQIDSLKATGKYLEYLKKLDIGMTKTCIAYKVGVVNFENNNKLFIWGITNSSYEACPYFSGTMLVGTFVNADKQIMHFNLGEISSAGDPPSTMNTRITSKITDNAKIGISYIITNDDMDIKGNEITTINFNLTIQNNRIVVEDSKKVIKNTEKTIN